MSSLDLTIVAVSRFTVPQTAAEHIAARFARRPRLVDKHEGFLGFEVLKTGIDPVTFVLITRWESRAKLKAYLKSSDFTLVHAGSEETVADFNVYDLIAYDSANGQRNGR
ncbi:MAG: antibiotic biosynthesis monooxygenase [Candidatus Binatus sp.]